MKRTISAVAIILLAAASSAHAFPFDIFKWGETQYTCAERAREKGKQNVTVTKDTVEYDETVFGKPGHVQLLFTGKTKVLAKVVCTWQQPAKLKDVKNGVCEKYGQWVQLDTISTTYYWREGPFDTDYRMELKSKYGFVELQIFGGENWRKWIKES